MMKSKKKAITGLAVVLLIFMGNGIFYKPVAVSAARAPKVAKTMAITAGQKKTIQVSGTYIKAKSFESANTSIATVSKKGVVTAKKVGDCKITITVKYLKTKKAKKLSTKKLNCIISVKRASKNVDDVSALTEIIKKQKALGAKISEDLDNEEQYGWGDNGRLEWIYWAGYGLSGNLSFSSFADLWYLNVSRNQLTGIDVSGNTALGFLVCMGSQLKKLDVSRNTALGTLNCDDNQLTALDISNNIGLTYLDCRNNQLASLTVGKNSALKILSCEKNQLTTLDVSGNASLEELNCGWNQLTSLNASGDSALVRLSCHNNQLKTLNIIGNTVLKTLYCDSNRLTTLDVSDSGILERLYCCNNQLTALDVSGKSSLVELFCYNNQLTAFDISGDTALRSLSCNNNKLTTLDLSGNVSLAALCCDQNVTVVGKPLNCEYSTSMEIHHEYIF